MKNLKVLVFALFTVLFLGFSHNSVEAHSPDLHEGVSGQDVTELQSTLQKLGYFHTTPTGYYGSITKEAVIQFQRDFNVPSTGFTGPLTRAKLSEVDMMARVVNGEARGESYTGQVAVAAVILNRMESSAFPSSTYNVVFQRNAFTAVNDGQYSLKPNSSAYQAVKAAVKGSDPSLGATYYYNPSGVTDTWIFSRTTITKIGKHVFAK
ncbi:cell wall hydrolase [Planococcus sp. CPCC 101016]|uniref:cell wall hydrolase n=1 Tax=Planococcus sp. CPCC 101016 TaxID=2599617 RepID=UPI0011B5F28B|nr:cell wall hydrolase [Planococcus sp. CPCC 101016]TWT04405.1 cell wall hydrolase [Planococcus sp. CPCC 101016]